MKISKVLKKYDTDKNKEKKGGHCYGKVYDQLFSKFDRGAELDIIEIGTEFGASLDAWREFFPNATISGVDIEDKVDNKAPDINYIISDVTDIKPEKKFDIVIDDGSHRLIPDVLHTVRNFKLKEGGIMVIEDVQRRGYWRNHIVKTIRHKYSVETINLQKVYGQYDDYLIVLRNYGYRE